MKVKINVKPPKEQSLFCIGGEFPLLIPNLPLEFVETAEDAHLIEN